MLNTKYVILAAVLVSAAPLADLSAQQKTEEQKPAYIKLDVNKDCGEIRRSHAKGENRHDYEAIDKELLAYYEANKAKVSPQQVRQIIGKLVENAARMKDETVVDKYVKMLEDAGEDMPRYTMFFVNGRFSSSYTYANEYRFCERLYAKYKDRIDPNYRLGNIANYATPGRNPGGFDASVKLIDELLSVKCANPKNDPKVEENFEKRKTGTLARIVQELLKFDYEKATPVLEKYQNRFSENQMADAYIAIAANAKTFSDRPLYDKMVAKIKTLSDGDIRAERIVRLSELARGTMVQDQLLDELLAGELTPQRRVDVLNRRYRLPGTRTYFIHLSKLYPEWKKAKLEQLKIIDANPERFKDPTNIYQAMYKDAWEYGDYKFAAELRDRILKLNGKNPICMWQQRVMEMVRLGRDKEASALLQQVLEAKKKVSQNDKNNWAIFKYFLDGGTLDGFDAAFADRKFTSEQKMVEIRTKACAVFFECGRHEKAREISDAVIAKMFRPIENNRHYAVKYMKKAPATAEAWARTADYQKWDQMETRFFPYSGSNYNVGDDKFLLKDAEQKKLKDEYRCGLHMVYDDLGVHIYLRANDPNVIEVEQGKRLGASLEWVLSPGDQNAYYWFYFKGIPDNSDVHWVNWAAPTKNYRLTYDVIFKDSALTPEGYAAHVFIPWIGVYDKLPSADNVWRVGLQVNNGDFRTLAGHVHELHRGIIMDFSFTPEQRVALERRICIQAFNRYNKIRRDSGGRIQNWNDIQLGDRAFYKASVEEYIKELDEAGKKLMEPAPDSEIHAIFTKYAPQWAEINYILEDKRADYLRDKLFSE